jgi:hypothetical protein
MYIMKSNWEIMAIAGVVILFFKVRPRLEELSWHFKVIHWTLIGIFILVGATGFRFLLLFLRHHDQFQSIFSEPNLIVVPSSVMRTGVLLFSVAAVCLFIAAMELGKFRKRARSIFVCLAPLCGIIYPNVMAVALGVKPSLLAYLVGLGLFVIGLLASIFYFRPPATEKMW